jgi:hypothetical protein
MTQFTIWEKTLTQLESTLPREAFTTYLAGSRQVSLIDGTLTVAVSTPTIKAWLEHRLAPTITRALTHAAAPLDPPQIKYIVGESPPPQRRPKEGLRGGESSPIRPDGHRDSYTAYEILTTDWPEPIWAIPGLLPAGLAGLTALPKIGKSYLALQLAHAISTGGHFLDHPVQAGKFLYFALEDRVQRLRSRMDQQQWAADQQQKLNNFITYDQFRSVYGKLDDGGAEILRQKILYHKYTLVVIDTFSWAFPGDQDRVDQMYAALGPVKQVALNNNCCVLVIDHHNKRASSGQELILDWLGSIGKAAITDTLWGLYREQGKAGAHLLMTGKDIEEQTHHIIFDKQTGLWRPDASAGFQINDHHQEILDILVDLNRARVGEIANAIEQNRGNAHKRLQKLVAEGYITRTFDQNGAVYYEPSQDYILSLDTMSVNTVNTVNTGKQVNKVNTNPSPPMGGTEGGQNP